MVFADAHYYLALMNRKDKDHRIARSVSETLAEPIVTTTWVLTEIGDGLCSRRFRRAFPAFVRGLQADSATSIVPPSEELFEHGLQLYERRPDKDWSLTDCVSFAVMQEMGITEALTGDHHFVQAGFRALLR